MRSHDVVIKKSYGLTKYVKYKIYKTAYRKDIQHYCSNIISHTTYYF